MHHFLKLTLSAVWLFPMQSAACPDSGPDLMESSARRITVAAPLYPTFSEPDGKGVFFDIIREVYEPEGYQVVPCILPIRRSIRDLQAGTIDLYLTDWHKDYLTEAPLYQPDKLYTPAIPISTELVSAAFFKNKVDQLSETLSDSRPSDSLPTVIESIFNNDQHLIAWNKGFDYHRLFHLRESSYQTVENVEQGLKMLKAGRIRLYLNDDDNIAIALQNNDEFKGSEYRIVRLREQSLYPVFQNSDQGLMLANLYDQRMRTLIEQDRILELYRQWGYDYQPGIPED